MLKVQNSTTKSYYNSRVNKNNQNTNPNAPANNVQSFGSSQSFSQKAWKWTKDQFVIDRNGSLTRAMFIMIAGVIMVGSRFFKSRDKDEKREVLTRDIPAVLISVLGAPFLNKALAYGTTKKTGIPIVKMVEPESKILKPFKVFHANFASQKQITDWYSELGTNATKHFAETIDQNGGKLITAFEKLGFIEKLEKITNAKDNKGIIEALKNAKAQGSEHYQALETAMKGLTKENPLVKYAQTKQAIVKLAGIGITAGILGFFLPRLNIVITRNKYKKKLDNGQINQAEFDKRMMRTSPVFRVSNGVLSFHKTSAQKTFKNLLDMVEAPYRQEK